VTEPLGAWEIQIKFDHKIFNVQVNPNLALFDTCAGNNDDDGDGPVNDGCPTRGAGEDVATECTNNDDDDLDGFPNDGCPTVLVAESGADCADSVDDDGDTFLNDGCPANSTGPGATPESGPDCGNAVDDDGDGYVNDGCAANGAPETDLSRTPNCSISVVTENWILFGCVSTGPEGVGFTGPIATLATVVLTPNEDLKFRLHPGNDNGVVRMILDENCEVTDTLGHAQPGSINGGLTSACGDAAVTVRILEGDLNLDCSVDVIDQQMIAGKYGTFFGNIFYDPWFDLEPALKDFDIDIKDLQKVFGRDGSTCGTPIPDQDPADGLSVGPL
jgi:hypothetical protein